MSMVSDELLRRAIFDPHVHKRRMLGHKAGLRINAGELRRALEQLMPEAVPSCEEIDAAIRRHGGEYVAYPIARSVRPFVRRLTGGTVPADKADEYWLDMYSWQRLRQQRPATHRPRT